MTTKQRKLPAAVGACVDLLYRQRTRRITLEREIEEMKEAERVLRDHIIVLLHESKLEGAKGAMATASITRKNVFKIADWPDFWNWARKDKLGVYVHKRVASEAVGEYMDTTHSGVPGVEVFPVIDLSVVKR
jgi:hypothetical protein